MFERRVAAWLSADVDTYLGCFAPDLRIAVPGREEPLDHDAYAALVRASFAWATPRAFEVHHLAVDGDTILAEWTITVARAEDGATVTWQGLSACETREGLIVDWREAHVRPPRPTATD